MRARAKLDAWLESSTPKKLTPQQSHKLRCIDCCGGQEAEVTKCPAVRCPGWMYRTGHYTPIPVAEWTSKQGCVPTPECPALLTGAEKVAAAKARTTDPLRG